MHKKPLALIVLRFRISQARIQTTATANSQYMKTLNRRVNLVNLTSERSRHLTGHHNFIVKTSTVYNGPLSQRNP